MSVFDEQPPIINKNNLIKWLKSNYSFLRSNTIRLIKFNSERDINFLISINKNKKYVLKISNPLCLIINKETIRMLCFIQIKCVLSV